MNLSKKVIKDFSFTLRVPSIDCFKSIPTQKNAYFSRISFSLDHSSVSWDNSSVLVYLQLYMLWTKPAHQSANFQTCDCSHEN